MGSARKCQLKRYGFGWNFTSYELSLTFLTSSKILYRCDCHQKYFIGFIFFSLPSSLFFCRQDFHSESCAFVSSPPIDGEIESKVQLRVKPWRTLIRRCAMNLVVPLSDSHDWPENSQWCTTAMIALVLEMTFVSNLLIVRLGRNYTFSQDRKVWYADPQREIDGNLWWNFKTLWRTSWSVLL